jgi:AcrR family transcriptional regulator
MARLAVATKTETQNQTRQNLLAAAAEEFATKGFVGANINQISLAAGFAKGTIYNYFPSKRDLMLALIDEIGAQHAQEIIARVELETQAVERIRQFFESGFAFVEHYPAQAQIAISAVFGFDAEFKERIYTAYQDLFTLLIDEVVAYGVDRQDFDVSNSNSTAALLMSIYLGGSSLLGADGRIWFDPEKVLEFVLNGIRKRDTDFENESSND